MLAILASSGVQSSSQVEGGPDRFDLLDDHGLGAGSPSRSSVRCTPRQPGKRTFALSPVVRDATLLPLCGPHCPLRAPDELLEAPARKSHRSEVLRGVCRPCAHAHPSCWEASFDHSKVLSLVLRTGIRLLVGAKQTFNSSPAADVFWRLP